MPFWSDALRVVGGVAAPVLAATGVGLPAAIAIGAAVAAGANVGADAVDRAAENAAADRRAAEERQRADQAIEQERQKAEAARRTQEAALQRQLAHAALPQKVLTACQNSDLHTLGTLLPQLDDTQLAQLGLAPLSACTDADIRAQVQTMLDAENKKRFG